jgi:integrase
VVRNLNRLSARAVETLGPGFHADGGCLYLDVDDKGRRRWVFMYTRRGKTRYVGLGSAGRGGVSLKAARERAAEGRALLKAGRDPLTEWRTPDEEEVPTFGVAADEYVATHQASWRSEKHRAQWATTLSQYCAAIRETPVDEIDTEAVLGVLKPLWTRAPETASRLRGRIEAVLDAARARGFVEQARANPARWKGHLDKLLSKRAALTRGHHAAMPYAEVPTFIAELRQRRAIAARALEFCILTAVRSSEALGARWEEIDLSAKVWTIPATRMKAGREHRVPLSDRALVILEEISAARTGDYVFAGQRRGRPLSGSAFEMLRQRLGASTTVHGFRSSFRDWAGDQTHFPRELAEQALAHAVGGAVEQAYRRSDALERRRALMDAWAAFVGGPSEAPSNVVKIGARR